MRSSDAAKKVPSTPDSDPRHHLFSIGPRIAAFQYATLGMFLWLISGFWNLEVLFPEFYNQRAQENHIKSIPIPAPRGRILDRDGRVIADNRVSFTLALARESLKEDHLPLIARGLDLDCNDLTERLRRYQSQPQYVPVVIKEELSLADLAFVDSHREFFPELILIQVYRRLYPQNGMLAHVIGYTAEVSEDELDSPEFAKYGPGDIIGKFGIEREYNNTRDGAKLAATSCTISSATQH